MRRELQTCWILKLEEHWWKRNDLYIAFGFSNIFLSQMQNQTSVVWQSNKPYFEFLSISFMFLPEIFPLQLNKCPSPAMKSVSFQSEENHSVTLKDRVQFLKFITWTEFILIFWVLFVVLVLFCFFFSQTIQGIVLRFYNAPKEIPEMAFTSSNQKRNQLLSFVTCRMVAGQ